MDRPLGLAAVVLVALLVLGCAWAQWRPWHSAQLLTASENAALAGRGDQALADAHGAVGADPLSLYARDLLAHLELDVGAMKSARSQLVRGTELQPDNIQSWQQLGAFDQQRGRLHWAITDWNHLLLLDAPANPTRVDTVRDIIAAEKKLAAEGHPVKAG